MVSSGSTSINYYRISDVAHKLTAINIIIGGRGIGKTYSTLDFVIDTGKKFIYMRNTDIQLKESTTSYGNPFKRWNADHDRYIYLKREVSHSVIYDGDNDNNIIGYGAALSTFENMRGVDLSDVEYVVYDEFIEKRKLTFKQFEAFISFYETANRNRELQGLPPLKCILLSNSQKLDNPILAGYGLIPIIESMIATGQKEYRKPGLYLSLPESEISDLKAQTDNYKLINGSRIAAEALQNKFAFDSFYNIKRRPINEYKCILMIDDIYIYKHKSNGMLYACASQALNVPEFDSHDNLAAFLRSYGRKLMDAAASGRLEYSDFVVKSKLLELIM